ncbi:short-chain dehydrogenase [Annulohypoxylon moriforme]|nr:short-chain dehydrogenase [Annulohypoxylon moriforme]
MSSNLIYLITGANRGIGKGLTESLLSRPSTTVIAAVRDLEKSTPILNAIPKATGSKLILVKLDSQIESDAAEAVSQLQNDHGISSVDVVIANAGISYSGGPVVKTTIEALRDHFNTNSIGPVVLFQAFRPLLKASKGGNPLFIALSSIIGSIGAQESLAVLPPIFSPYGASKTALNWLIRRIHFEEPWLTSFVFHPGLVLTEMSVSIGGPNVNPVDLGAITVDVSVGGMLKTIDSATREISGTFQVYDGGVLPW